MGSGRFRGLLLLSAAVFSIFVLIAYLSPATYQAEAVVKVVVSNAVASKDASGLAETLKSSVLSEALYAQLTRANLMKDAASEKERALVEARLRVTAMSAESFSFTFYGPDANLAMGTCNLIAQHAIEVAPTLFGAARNSDGSERARRSQELLDFLKAHPEVAAEPPSNDPKARSAGGDRTLLSLNAERQMVEKQLAELQKTNPDNPYDIVDEQAVQQTKNRLAALARAIQRHKDAVKSAASSKPEVSSEVRAKWTSLLDQLRETQTDPPPRPTTARVVSWASLPTSPVEPDRPSMILSGAIASVVVLGGSVLLSLPLLSGRERALEASSLTLPKTGDGDGTPTGKDAEPAPAMSPPEAVKPSPPTAPTSKSPPQQEAHKAPSNRPGGDGQAAAPKSIQEGEVNAARSAYVPPERHVTQVFGTSTDALAGRNASEPPPQVLTKPKEVVSARYSYSSRPPPPEVTKTVVTANDDDGSAEVMAKGLQLPGPPRTPETVKSPVEQHRWTVATPVTTHRPTAPWMPDPHLVHANLAHVCKAIMDEGGGNKRCVVAVTSLAELSKAKSRAAAGIALALGRAGKRRVLLAEGDFQSPNAHRSINVQMPLSTGFSQQLQNADATRAQQNWHVVECSATLHVLAEGVIRSPGAILWRQFERCISELGDYYSFVVIDGPPLTADVEKRALSQVVDGVIIARTPNSMELPQEAYEEFEDKSFLVDYPCL